MKRIKLLKFLIIPVTLLLLARCEKDKITDPLSIKTEDCARLLWYLEDEGDIINTIPLPSLEAWEVNENLGSSLVIDLRTNSNYMEGHIIGAINIQHDSLFKYIQTNYLRFSDVVLVSASGQSAAYYTSLLRLAGFSNVYYMNFGMASWNTMFSSVWNDRLALEPDTTILFTHTDYPKRSFSSLPQINIIPSNLPMKEFVETRIEGMIKEGFDEEYSTSTSNSTMRFSDWKSRKEQLYTICIGSQMFYSSSSDTTITYHPEGAVLYHIPGPADFRSTSYLQTLPSKGSIAMYSGTGQESAFYTAYLRLLGYNVKSILFGMNNIDYYMLLRADEIIPYAFQLSTIMNYPFETGQGNK
ncbi:MAG: rhodanese-like domain-containing protein [Ignavibacteriaceae bacterium]|jgi:rhodanese-related sulfurtransferase